MPKSVKEVLLERQSYESLKGFYNVIPTLDEVIANVESAKANSKIGVDAFNECTTRLVSVLGIAKSTAEKAVIIGRECLSEAKQFEEDADFAHFSHGLITCYIDPVVNRFILTKDSHNGLRNYDTIINMTKNDLKNIIKCCNDMLADIKAEKVPEEEPKEE